MIKVYFGVWIESEIMGKVQQQKKPHKIIEKRRKLVESSKQNKNIIRESHTYNFLCWKHRTRDRIAISIVNRTLGTAMQYANSST